MPTKNILELNDTNTALADISFEYKNGVYEDEITPKAKSRLTNAKDKNYCKLA